VKHSRRLALKTIVGSAALQTVSLPAPAASRFRLIVLDVGGTIIEDRGDVPEALRSACANHGMTVSPAEIAELRGASKRDVVRTFVERRTKSEGDRKKLVEAIYQDFNAQVKKAYSTAKPIAGAEDAFVKLRGSGFLLATGTGFDREITASIFDRLGWMKYFAATITSDDVAEGRPAPFMIFHAMEAARVNSVSEVVVVGDTPLDLQAGNNSGVRGVIAVLSGASTAERLRTEPSTQILSSVADLPAYLG
jgi:phosphonatase-like hydrolase